MGKFSTEYKPISTANDFEILFGAADINFALNKNTLQ